MHLDLLDARSSVRDPHPHYVVGWLFFCHNFSLHDLETAFCVIMSCTEFAALTNADCYVTGLDQFVGTGVFCPTIVIFLGYGLAVASSTYCLTFFFSDHTVAQFLLSIGTDVDLLQNVVLLIHFFSGLILMVISFIMDVIETTASTNCHLKNIFRISPGFCFADGLASLALVRQGMKDKTSDQILDWNVTGASICYLCIESILYFLLALGFEVLPPHKMLPVMIDHCWRRIKGFCLGNTSDVSEPLLGSSSDAVSIDLVEDVDVKAERDRVLSGAADRAIIYLRNLCKVYPAGKHQVPKVAVHSLTFAVHEGECFGFLGTNGAGKTTTLSGGHHHRPPTLGLHLRRTTTAPRPSAIARRNPNPKNRNSSCANQS
ncbi:hypothetical protein Cgig2_025898 [Carnegiea gigantea]|uniref:ABC-2 type transporter transmembrane domain-containing protein n=1 Tax=Carnegiea gigantea TaxID=171969 RepID=A0A9Q1K4D6_9CARY|nr:hypothetical protein Cgig2_025898 [Carnegiea gigantea]